MKRPVKLDLGCCAGGAAKGYDLAGYEVVGVDLAPQPHFPYAFVQLDMIEAMERLLAGDAIVDRDGRAWTLDEIDSIHASPPCQRWSALRHLPFLAERCLAHPDLITPLRPLLEASGKPWTIENVMGAPLVGGWLCGTMFDRKFYRHRRFETSWNWLQPSHPMHRGVIGAGQGINAHRTKPGTPGWIGAYGHQNSVKLVGAAFDIDWMNRNELSQCLPPIYTLYLGIRELEYFSGEPFRDGAGVPML